MLRREKRNEDSRKGLENKISGEKNKSQPSEEVFLEKSFDAQDGLEGSSGWVTEVTAVRGPGIEQVTPGGQVCS